jgi:hypothetical protein
MLQSFKITLLFGEKIYKYQTLINIKNKETMEKIPSSSSERDQILRNHRQLTLRLKLSTNNKKIDTKNPIFIQDIKRKGLVDYIVVGYENEIAVSNISEISDSENNSLI